MSPTTTIEPLLYAPQARLVDLETGKIIGTNVTQGGQAAILSGDLISASVTLPNTGIAQLAVTLNNQRFFEGHPVFPPWKYNNFAKKQPGAQNTFSISLGQLLRLDLRYSGMQWVKMIVARVTDLQFTFPQSGGAQLKVVGEDMLSALKIKPKDDIPYDGKQEEVIATETLKKAQLDLTVRSEGIEKRPQPWRAARHQKSQTYFQFLSDIADRMDCELYVDFKDRASDDDKAGTVPKTGDAKSEVSVVMEPARSKTRKPGVQVTSYTALDLKPTEFFELRWGKNLIDFTPKLKVWEMPTSASVSGSQPTRRGRVTAKLSADDVKDAIKAELPKSPIYDVEPIDAVTARTQFFDTSDPDNQDSQDGSNLDEARAKMKALAGVLKKVREFMTAEANTIGIPLLRPGSYIHISGMRPPFDGFYYVTKTVHTYDSNGYRTQFSLRRPGMLPPENYLTFAKDEKQPATTPTGGT
jgi:hypothetical protein